MGRKPRPEPWNLASVGSSGRQGSCGGSWPGLNIVFQVKVAWVSSEE